MLSLVVEDGWLCKGESYMVLKIFTDLGQIMKEDLGTSIQNFGMVLDHCIA